MSIDPQIFMHVIPGRGIPVKNQANTSIIESWLHPDEVPDHWWFSKVLREQPELGDQLLWTKPIAAATKANEAQDKETLQKFLDHNKLHFNQASFLVLRERYGAGLTYDQIVEAIKNRIVGFTPYSSEEKAAVAQQHQEEALAADQLWLKTQATPEQLRERARQDYAASRPTQQSIQEQRNQDILRRIDMDLASGKVLMPHELYFHGVDYTLDAAFMQTVMYRHPILYAELKARYGAAQLSARLLGLTRKSQSHERFGAN